MKENLPLWKLALNASPESFGLIPAGFSPIFYPSATPSVAQAKPVSIAPNASPQAKPVSNGFSDDNSSKAIMPLDGKKYNYIIGDEGKVVLEINIRLAGFGGMLPTEKFTELTKNGVKQFQGDYMKMKAPTGEADYNTLKAIDEFSENYREDVSNYKCVCGSCSGFGKGEKNENPGVHRSLLWGISALKYYLSQQTEYKYNNISSGYRCNAHNKLKGRTSTNHMGSAVDIQFKYNNGKLPIGRNEIDKLKKIRDGFFIKYLCAVEGWEGKKNSYRLEPIGTGKDESYSWIHIDVVKFEDKYKKDNLFVKEQLSVKGKALLEMG